jgi:DNA-binding CsgD family transcriptional regulator
MLMSLALDKALARLISQMGSESLPSALRGLLEECCSFDSMVVTRYLPNSPPQSLYHDLDEVQAAITVQFYATGPYLLDPLYQHCRCGGAPGAYRLLDLASDAFLRSEYYRTFYRKIRISDELGAMIRQGDKGWIIISLARSTRRASFTTGDLARVTEVYEVIAATALRHWGEQGTDPRSDDGALDNRLASFGAGRLSTREAQIVQLVLQGHSTPSLAAHLGITEGTVKVHRHNAYSKLGIGSQAELFALATRHFLAGAG